MLHEGSPDAHVYAALLSRPAFRVFITQSPLAAELSFRLVVHAVRLLLVGAMQVGETGHNSDGVGAAVGLFNMPPAAAATGPLEISPEALGFLRPVSWTSYSSQAAFSPGSPMEPLDHVLQPPLRGLPTPKGSPARGRALACVRCSMPRQLARSRRDRRQPPSLAAGRDPEIRNSRQNPWP